jgi:hypothetical protein
VRRITPRNSQKSKRQSKLRFRDVSDKMKKRWR